MEYSIGITLIKCHRIFKYGKRLISQDAEPEKMQL